MIKMKTFQRSEQVEMLAFLNTLSVREIIAVTQDKANCYSVIYFDEYHIDFDEYHIDFPEAG